MLQAAKYIGAGLATIGLTKQILSPVLSPRLLCPSVISSTAIVAINVLDEMLRSLPKDSIVLNHIIEVAAQSESLLQVTAQAQGDLVKPLSSIEFSEGNIPEGSVTKDAGVYAFTEKVVAPGQTAVRQAFGSAINFQRRLRDHKDQFLGLSRQTSLHKSGDMSSFAWGTVYQLPNYLSLFYLKHPHHQLSQGDYNILMAVTQLVPRILEQSIFEHFKSELTGKDRLVRFTYTRFNSESLNQPLELGSTSTKVFILQDNVPVQTASILGVGRKSIQLYLNHTKPINSPSCGTVNIQETDFVGPLLTHPIVHRVEPTYDKFIIPGYAPTTLEPGTVYTFTEDLQPEGTYPSFTSAASDLCVSGNSPRGLRNSITRALNTDRPVSTRLGPLYFVQNPNSPNRFTQNHMGQYPCTLHDLETGTKVSFDGLKPIVSHLS